MELKWRAPEFEFREKGVGWYWLSIIVAVVILGVAVWQRNFLFGFFVIVAEVLVLAWGNREPEMAEFRMTEKGLALPGQKFHLWSELDSWSAEEEDEEEWQNIFLHFRSRFRPAVKIKIPKNESRKIKDLFGSRLPEIEHEPSLLDSLEEFLRF